MRNTSRREGETMREALDRLGATLDEWSAEQRWRKWAKALADDDPSVTYPFIGRNAEPR